jgi:hypothetical protein
MEENIIDEIIKNYSSASLISRNIKQAEEEIMKRFFRKVEKIVNKKLKLNYPEWQLREIRDDHLTNDWGGIMLIKERWATETLGIYFEGLKKLVVGINKFGITAGETEFDREKINGCISKCRNKLKPTLQMK